MIDMTDRPLDPPESEIELPDGYTLVSECSKRIVNGFATDIIVEFMGESNGDGRSVACAWLDAELAGRGSGKFVDEVIARLADVEDIQQSWVEDELAVRAF